MFWFVCLFFNIIILLLLGFFYYCCGFVGFFLVGDVCLGFFVEDYADYSPQLPFLSPLLQGEEAVGHVGLCHRLASTVPEAPLKR